MKPAGHVRLLHAAVERRQEERTKDERLKAIADLMESEGWFTSIDADELASAIESAERAGCPQRQLETPKGKLAQLRGPKPPSTLSQIGGAVAAPGSA